MPGRENRGETPQEETLGFLRRMLSMMANIASGAGNEVRDFGRTINRDAHEIAGQIKTGVDFGMQVASLGIKPVGHAAKFVAEKSQQGKRSKWDEIIQSGLTLAIVSVLGVGAAPRLFPHIRDTSPEATNPIKTKQLTPEQKQKLEREITNLLHHTITLAETDEANDIKIAELEQKIETLYYSIFGVSAVGGMAFFVAIRNERIRMSEKTRIAACIVLIAALIDGLIYFNGINPANQDLKAALQNQAVFEQKAQQHEAEIEAMLQSEDFRNYQVVQPGNGALDQEALENLLKLLEEVPGR